MDYPTRNTSVAQPADGPERVHRLLVAAPIVSLARLVGSIFQILGIACAPSESMPQQAELIRSIRLPENQAPKCARCSMTSANKRNPKRAQRYPPHAAIGA